jgi:UDP-MurNAc hydroxylase
VPVARPHRVRRELVREQSDQTEDAEIDGWTVQRRCPHLRADLTKTGKIEDGVLTCALHDWKWDLASGQCLTTPGHPIRRRASSRRRRRRGA